MLGYDTCMAETSTVPMSIKMRASLEGRHISGAERIVEPHLVPSVSSELATRALRHEKGVPDSINIATRAVAPGNIIYVNALNVGTRACENPEFAQTAMMAVLAKDNHVSESAARRGIGLLYRTRDMRGASIVCAETGERLDTHGQRGVRVGTFDWVNSPCAESKNHRADAVALASKALAAPGIVAEVCIADDLSYTTGYVAVEGSYTALRNVKAEGGKQGGRVLFYSGALSALPETEQWLREKPVLVEGSWQ
mgnify:FL=1